MLLTLWHWFPLTENNNDPNTIAVATSVAQETAVVAQAPSEAIKSDEPQAPTQPVNNTSGTLTELKPVQVVALNQSPAPNNISQFGQQQQQPQQQQQFTSKWLQQKDLMNTKISVVYYTDNHVAV